MRKLRKYFLILTLGLGFQSEAQILRINNECNPLVSSLHDIVYIVRQEYALKDTNGTFFGQNNQEFFGYRYGAALMWNGKLYINPLTYYAHQLDSVAGTYGSEYTPLPFRSYFKAIDESAFTKIDAEALTANPEKVVANFPDSLCGKQTLENDSNERRKTILITFECRDDVWNDTSHFRMNFLYKNLITEPNGTVRLDGNSLGNFVQFALIFDEVTEVGSARLEFKGFAEVVQNDVKIHLITVDPEPEPEKEKKGKRNRR